MVPRPLGPARACRGTTKLAHSTRFRARSAPQHHQPGTLNAFPGPQHHQTGTLNAVPGPTSVKPVNVHPTTELRLGSEVVVVRTPRVRERVWRERVVDVNDGILGVAGLLQGLVAADIRNSAIVVTASVAIVAGAVSMGALRYTEACFNRDAVLADVAEERRLLELSPDEEFQELVDIYVGKGLSQGLAQQVATELTDHDALAAHLDDELDIDDEDFEPPWFAGLSAALAFAVGALVPALIAFFVPPFNRLLVTLAVVIVSLSITSFVGAKFGGTHPVRTVTRAVAFGLLTIGIASAVGEIVD